MTQKVVRPIALDESFRTTEQNPKNIADVLANKLDAIKSAIENGGSDEMEAAFECHYNVTSATDIYNAMQDKKVPFFYQNGVVAQLWKVETNKYTFRTTSTRVVEGENILDIVDYIVNGSVWSTATKTISGGSSSQQAYLAKVESSVNFDTTGLSGMQSIISVNDVPADGVYQLSIFMCIIPKTASATKSDLVFQFTGTSGTGMPNTTFHAVVDDSQTFGQQLSFSTTLNLKAGTNTLKMACGGLNTEYIVFVDNLTVAQLVNGVYHNGDSFEDVNNLQEATSFNEGDNFLLVSPLSVRKMNKDTLIDLISQAIFDGSRFYVDNHNKEFIYSIIDKNGVFLYGIKENGDIEWAKGIPTPIKTLLDVITSRIDVQDLLINNKVDKVEGKSLINSIFASCVFVINNPEYVYAINDSNGVFLFGLKKDGSIDWAKGLPVWLEDRISELELNKVDKEEGKSLINETFANEVQIVSNKEFVFAFVDSENKFLFGVKTDGSIEWSKGVPLIIQDIIDEIQISLNNKQDKIEGKTLIDEEFSSHSSSTTENQEWFWTLLDNENKVVEGINQDGTHNFNLPLKFNGGVDWSKENLDDLSKALKDNGFTGGTGDWSDNESLEIPIPKIAIINFTGISQMPQTKTTDAHAYIEFWDMNGNYFKKKAILNAQGSSSMKWAKKNISIDLCNDDWIGDDTFKIKFGEWVSQDGFHIKAYASDYFRCVALAGYDFVKEIADTRKLNATWKQALNYSNTNYTATDAVSPQNDSGALCFPQGFICKVYLNGSFEGLFCWQLKKHRDNYNMKKNNTKHIHIEGMITQTNFWNGSSIDWTTFEVRNPKDLINYNGTKYDGDNPQELIDSTSPAYDASNSKHVNTAIVKQYIINLSRRMNEIGNDKTLFETYFGLDSCIDYVVMTDAIYNYDYAKNIQWTTWDGVKWYVNPYDLDCTLGANSSADSIHYPTTSHTIQATNHPVTFVVNNYTSELEARWSELRNKGVIDPISIAKKVEKYMRTFGNEGYNLEYSKWTDNPCNRNPVYDTENWDVEVDANGNPVIYTSEYHTWNDSISYTTGYVVQYNPSAYGEGWYFRFTAKQNNTNKPPITRGGFKDNIFRVYNWLEKQISNMDSLYNFN